ncbi:hypothetical protein ABEB36_015603 [Hypothenemus hampei]|uniref:Uncharacterized protein n=1 Tax=Hypothenemus hampei TaxID=57062 RepID=A0ABD1E020_HYPHA
MTNLNQYFQSDKIILQDVHNRLTDAYKDFLLCYMNNRYVSTTELSSIDPANKTWFLPKNQVYFGINVMSEIKKPIISERQDLLDHFFERCQQFYSVLCVEIKKRYDFDNFILSKIHIFSPKKALCHQTHEQYSSLCDILAKTKRFHDTIDEQLIDDEWRLLRTINSVQIHQKKLKLMLQMILIFFGENCLHMKMKLEALFFIICRASRLFPLENSRLPRPLRFLTFPPFLLLFLSLWPEVITHFRPLSQPPHYSPPSELPKRTNLRCGVWVDDLQ